MVNYTELICQQHDSSLAQILTFDTPSIELYFEENNPKTTYFLMTSQVDSCQYANQQYITSHFCYADKFAILTNGLGIVRHISFLDDDFKSAHPEMKTAEKSDC